MTFVKEIASAITTIMRIKHLITIATAKCNSAFKGTNPRLFIESQCYTSYTSKYASIKGGKKEQDKV